MIRTFYKKLRNILSPKQKAWLSQMVFIYSGKPFYKKDSIPREKKFPGGQKGGFIISADFELGWAWRYTKINDDQMGTALKMARQARKNFPFLIKYLDQYKVPITWATVGHLFLEKCGEHDHDWMEKIPYFENRNWRYDRGNWFDCDPHTHWEEAKEWYGPDLIRMIQQADVDHEISTHTFTHIDFSDENCPEKVADDEIKACIQAMEPYGEKPESIVFPGGTFGNTKVLKNNGINIYRKNVDVDLAYPYYDDLGLLVSPTTSGFGKTNEWWTAEYYVKRFKAYIDKAIKTGTIAHLWFHPSFDEFTLHEVFPKVLEYVNTKMESGELWVGSMKEIADHINSNKQDF